MQTARHRLTRDGLFPLCIFDVILFNRHLSCLQMVAAPPPPCFPFRAEQLTYLCCRLWTCQCSLSRRMSCLHAGKYLEFFLLLISTLGKPSDNPKMTNSVKFFSVSAKSSPSAYLWHSVKHKAPLPAPSHCVRKKQLDNQVLFPFFQLSDRSVQFFILKSATYFRLNILFPSVREQPRFHHPVKGILPSGQNAYSSCFRSSTACSAFRSYS